uniref:C-1-tetrahydrofolate synthase, cytoplasmic n=1 Tax=Ditylenchus dipsaci TaxID=166011 RepID=A0A915D1E8_9BILA
MAKLIDGKAISQQVLDEVQQNLKAIQEEHPHFKPTLAIVQVGNRSDSNVYIGQTRAEVGMDTRLIKLSEQTTEAELTAQIDALNNDKEVDGIIVQLPLESVHPIDADSVIDRIDQSKDVDGLTRENAGRLMRGELEKTIFPCTPYGCLHLVQQATGDAQYVKGKTVVVVGRSKIVGSPAAALFMWHHGTATICHSRTTNLREQCLQADILIVAIGQKELIKGDARWQKKTKRDVHFEQARQVAGYITPVPGGVGPMTVAMLMKNTFQQAVASKLKNASSSQWNIAKTVLNPLVPVPSDIDVSRAYKPKHIEKLAKEIGLHSDELEMYGKTKAKVLLKTLNRLANRKNGKYVVVVGITPTPLGEGKSTTTIDWCKRCPTFGIKGGAAGGGYSQVIPMEEFNLHLTGDIHAITAAHNLMAAAIDARMFHESTQTDEALFNRLVPHNKEGKRILSKIQQRRLARLNIAMVEDANQLSAEDRKRFSRLNIDANTITWTRVIDTNDRFLRKMRSGTVQLRKDISELLNSQSQLVVN